MPNRQTLLTARSTRLPGDAGDEVLIGAYARRQFRRRVAVGALGAALILGAIWLYLGLRPDRSALAEGTYEAPIRCLECRYEGTARISVSQPPPLPCPKCTRVRCMPLWKCAACGQSFLPVRSTPPVRCTKCGSDNVGSAAPPP